MQKTPLPSPETSPAALGAGTKELVATRWSMPLDDGTSLVVTGHEPGVFRLRVCAEGARENPLVRYGLVAQGLAPAPLRISEGVSYTVLRLGGAMLRVAHETGAAELFTTEGEQLVATSALEDGMDRGYRWRARYAAGDRLYGLGDVTHDAVVDQPAHRSELILARHLGIDSMKLPQPDLRDAKLIATLDRLFA